MASVLRTILIDSDPESLATVRRVLAASSSAVVVGEFAGLGEALVEAPARRPDLVIVEIPERRAAEGPESASRLIEEVSRVSDLTKKHSEIIVDTVFKSIINALHRGDKIELRGFGSFRIRQRESRKGRNPKTGERVDVPAKKVPYFKPGKELKELINTSEETGLAAAED